MRTRWWVRACALMALVLSMQTGLAYGEVQSISGMDQYFGAEDTNGSIDILSVAGSANDTVFIEVTQGKRIIASHLAFTLGEDTSAQEGDVYTGVASVSIANYDPASTYAIAVYADRGESQLLYEGTLSPVYAQLEGQDNAQLIAVRTLGGEERTFNPLGNLSFNNATYTLASPTPTSTDPFTYAYKLVGEASEVEASLSYVDDNGDEIAREDLGTLAVGEHKSVEVPAAVKASDGRIYRTVSFSDTLTVANPGTTQYVILCKEVAGTEVVGSEGNAYLACIHLNDTEGNRLADDTVNVNVPFLYTPPARLHISNPDTGLVDTYTLSSDNGLLTEGGALSLIPSVEPIESGQQDYEIAYTKLGENDATTWTVVLLNGSVDPKDPTRTIARETFEVAPGETKTYKPKKSITVDGEEFVPVSPTKKEYSYTFGVGDDPVTNIYYVPANYVAPEPYDIEVRYVNIANNEVLQAHTLTVRPQDRDELEITSPERFTLDGIEYVRLAGQEKSIFHSFYSSNRVYNIYYRDINDELSAGIVITDIDVEYVDGPETITYVDGGTIYTYTDGGYTRTNGGTTTNYVDGGTTYVDGPETVTYVDGGETVTNGGTTVRTVEGGPTRDLGTTTIDRGTTEVPGSVGGTASVPAAVPNGVTGAAIPRTEGMRVIGNGNSRVVTDSSGRDTNTIRIEDNETPLAGPSSANNGKANTASAATKVDPRVLAALGALAAAVGLLFLLLFFKRRKQDDEEEQEGEGELEERKTQE